MAGFGLTIIFVPLAALITYSRPDYVASVESAIRDQSALTFMIGLFTNLILGLITTVLYDQHLPDLLLAVARFCAA